MPKTSLAPAGVRPLGGGDQHEPDDARSAPCPRAAIYLRVSTAEQSLSTQRPAVLQLVRARGLNLVKVYEEVGSAAKKRPVLDQMMLDAHRGEFGVLVVWAIDRLGRSLFDNIAMVRKLADCGVRLVSVREPWLDTGGPTADLILAVMSWVAQFERERLRERTRAGLARARAQGKRIGRPPAEINLKKALALLDAGLSYRKAARELGVGASTLHRAVAEHRMISEASETAEE